MNLFCSKVVAMLAFRGTVPERYGKLFSTERWARVARELRSAYAAVHAVGMGRSQRRWNLQPQGSDVGSRVQLAVRRPLL